MTDDDVEDLESFRQRARTWIRANLGSFDPQVVVGSAAADLTEAEELAAVEHDRELQRMLFDAGLAGICIPRDYGGQGLTPTHQRVLNQELSGYEYPSRFQVPGFSPCAAVLLDFGTEEQKRQHIPKMLNGEHIWMQLLSEPSGGSDVASALTTAVRDGDEWIVNGSKVWTTGAWWSDWGLCLVRTNWDVPKHRGLTVFILPLHQEGVDVQRIEMLDGSKEFCQEFLTDVRVPDSDRIGAVDDGWTVGTRWMFHERMLFNSPLVTMPEGAIQGRGGASTVTAAARAADRMHDPTVRDLVGEAVMLDSVRDALQKRLAVGIASGKMSSQSAAIGRLFHGVVSARHFSLAYEVAGAVGGAWLDTDGAAGSAGIGYLMRQTGCIGGGTTEMARNVISERVLGMPRERSHDREIAFREVPRGPSNR
jgi:alkylation response protein AidB-like acyl-CoA dehydrogenase